MSKETKRMRVPKLRFPDFLDAGEWQQLPIGEKIDLLSGYPFKSSEISEDSSGIPLMRGINITEGFIRHSQDIDRFYLGSTKKLEKYKLRTNDLVIGMDGSKVGKNSALITENDSGSLLIQRVARLRTNCNATIQFIFQQINSPTFHSYVDRINTSGGIPHISAKQINEFEICFPNLEEQQKIADCLSSIDDLISAQSQKIDALKAHKKGLMQQLFPAEGEAVPKLRFPEFRDAGEWEVKSIQQLIDEKAIIGHLDGNHGALYPRAEEFSQEGVPYISANDFITGFIDFGKCKYLPKQRALQFKKGVAKDGDILFAHNATVGPVAKLNTDFQFVILSTTATYFRCNNKYLINDFLKFALSSPRFVKQYTRVMSQSTRNQVPITAQRKFNLQLPVIAEQQKIADCLSSIEELITAQSQKIDALKAHKKGLMQQLFPSTDEMSR